MRQPLGPILLGTLSEFDVDAPREREDALFVGSVEKAAVVLDAFGADRPAMGLQELVQATGLGKSAVQRYAFTLHTLGYLERDPVTRQYRPGLKLLELANAYLCADDLVRNAMPKLIDLRQKIGETVNMARLDGTDIVYVVRLPSMRTNYAATIPGRRVPALNTSSGRAILSTFGRDEAERAASEWPLRQFTPQTSMDREVIAEHIRHATASGYTISQSELILSEVGIAAPIIAPGGRAKAAIHCSVSRLSWSPEQIERTIVPHLLDAANSIA